MEKSLEEKMVLLQEGSEDIGPGPGRGGGEVGPHVIVTVTVRGGEAGHVTKIKIGGEDPRRREGVEMEGEGVGRGIEDMEAAGTFFSVTLVLYLCGCICY